MSNGNEVTKTDDVLPPVPNYNTIVDAIILGLSKLPGADGHLVGRSHVALERNHAIGYHTGKEHGFRDGYQRGYSEGLEEGRREALDSLAAEEAQRASLKAAARARYPG